MFIFYVICIQYIYIVISFWVVDFVAKQYIISSMRDTKLYRSCVALDTNPLPRIVGTLIRDITSFCEAYVQILRLHLKIAVCSACVNLWSLLLEQFTCIQDRGTTFAAAKKKKGNVYCTLTSPKLDVRYVHVLYQFSSIILLLILVSFPFF